MDVAHLVVQIIVAMICAGIGNFLIPRKIPGGFLGLLLIGLAGVWLGEWSFQLLRRQYSLDHPLLHFAIQGVPIIPSIIGSAIILYIVTGFLKWGRYAR